MNAFPIISADMRAKENKGISICIFGKSGMGKTSLLKTTSETRTLFVDSERGGLSVIDWRGDTIRPNTWRDWCNLAAFVAGPNPAMRDDQFFSIAHYEAVCRQYGDPSILDKYDTLFIDSITTMGRHSLQWAEGESIVGKTGKIDSRASYGLHGHGMIDLLIHLQQYSSKNIVYVGILTEKRDEFGNITYELQIEGNKVSSELFGIMDIVATMAIVEIEPGRFERALICHADNPFKFPAKSRATNMNCIEEAHIGKFIAKARGWTWQNGLLVHPKSFETTAESNSFKHEVHHEV